MRMHACMHARTYVCGNLSIPEPTSTNAQQECKEKAAVQRPDSNSRWIANPSREKQTDRKHEMDGEECKGKKVLFPGFSKQAALPSEKQKAQIRTGENRGGQLIQRTFTHQTKPRRGMQPPQSHTFHPVKSKWIGYKAHNVSGSFAKVLKPPFSRKPSLPT